MAITPYPVSYALRRPDRYNRLTVLFRIIVIIPQYVLLFGFPFVLFAAGLDADSPLRIVLQLLGYISLTLVLNVLVFLAWFAILFSGRFPQGFLKTCVSIFRWEQNVGAYVLLLTADYPPFAPGPYALQLEIQSPQERNRLTTFFRSLLAIPHFVVLFFLGIGLEIITFIAWFAILFTGQYPRSMYDFSVGVARWSARLTAYLYLFVDVYPPFSLAAQPGATLTAELA